MSIQKRLADCLLTAKVTALGVIKIILDKMPDGFKGTKSFIQIDVTEGKNFNTTTVDIIRKP